MGKALRFEIQGTPNAGCLKQCNKEKRRDITEEDLCILTESVIDNLPIRCVGEWAQQKIYHLVQYFGIFAKGMKNKWDGNINYIEICSGPGRCISRSDGYEFNGTSLCILEHEARGYLKKALFFDYNDQVISTLNKRIHYRNIPNALAIKGDYYDADKICADIIRETDGQGLNLIFIDPTDCSVPFQLIATLKQKLRNVDLIINFAVGTDFNRNIRNALQNPDRYQSVINKYTNFLGSTEFFERATPGASSMELRKLFRDNYSSNLQSIGYNFLDFKRIEHYYDLIFATCNQKGIDFWKSANQIKFDGQRQLF